MLSAPSCPGSAAVRRGWVSEAGGELGPPASTHTAGETPLLSRAWPYPEAEDRLQAQGESGHFLDRSLCSKCHG